MELGLSLGDNTPKALTFHDKTAQQISKGLGFCMGLGTSGEEEGRNRGCSDPPVQLELLPFSPVQRHHHPPPRIRFPWLTENLAAEPGSSNGPGKGLDVNRQPPGTVADENRADSSSPNSAASSFRMDFSIYGGGRSKRGLDTEEETAADRGGSNSRGSDEEETNAARKKLRLTKEQSAFLEDSFKEHNTLNPKQKLALAKQLNLRPRQVEVWYQNRRARTKLKQTEVDCEYLKRCCERLTEENRRLQKELHELRALKTSQPFFMQLPATTLTMCPSCERVVTTTNAATTAATAATATDTVLSLSKPKSLPFPHAQLNAKQAAS